MTKKKKFNISFLKVRMILFGKGKSQSKNLFCPIKKTNLKKVKHFILSTTFLFLAVFSTAQIPGLNYDESKVPVYTLPDPLTFNNGEKVTTVEQWEKKRRPELLEFFSSQMYGRTPKEKIRVTYQIVSENPNFMNGKATAKQVKFIFTNDGKNVQALLLLVLPNGSKEKIPVFVSYNYGGNHSTTFDTTIVYSPSFALLRIPEQPDRERGRSVSRWPYEQILERGYGIATMFFEEIYHDSTVRLEWEEQSIAALFTGYNLSAAKAPDQWQALGAWAWGSSRIVDYLETQEWVDMEKIIIMGHSRQGKAALWAGAQDERFKMVISNNSGSCGAALSKRAFGEDIARILRHPHWFCPAFSQYVKNEAALPFDQHELIALIAPRYVYIASAVEDYGADPKGEYLSGYHAGPVYELYGLKGLESEVQPPLNQPVMNDIGYHIRTGGHDVTDYDWACYMDFADKHFGKPK